MTVHMVRLMIEPPKGNAESAVDNWVQNHTEWEDDPVAHSLVETTTGTDGDGTAYARGDYRFLQEETATALLDDLESRLQSFQGGLWYRIGYHVCPHDEPSVTTMATSTWTADSDPATITDEDLTADVFVTRDGWEPVTVDGDRSGYRANGNAPVIRPRRDFIVDRAAGTIATTPSSRLVTGESYTVEYTYYHLDPNCSWTDTNSDTRENGTIPSDIPELT